MGKHSIIMIIDDDDDDRSLFKEALLEINKSIVCHEAANGEDGLKLLKKIVSELPHCIFLDLNMPRMDGRQFLAELKKQTKFSQIPVIIYTTSKGDIDIAESRKLGACHFITKPPKFSELKKAIVRALDVVNNMDGKRQM